MCNRNYECQGLCWLNVAGVYDVWEILSCKCKGTKAEQECLDRLVHNETKEKKLRSKFNLSDKEIRLIKEFYLI